MSQCWSRVYDLTYTSGLYDGVDIRMGLRQLDQELDNNIIHQTYASQNNQVDTDTIHNREETQGGNTEAFIHHIH